jgi:hypothetical protein
MVGDPGLKFPQRPRSASRMPDTIEVYTARYEREHGHKPQGKRFWRFILVSQNVTAKDHTLVLDQPMIYPMASPGYASPSGSSSSHRKGVTPACWVSVGPGGDHPATSSC